ncbi:MAG TPA: outer membrane protein assembly factor BamB [Pseudomonadales bacterium]|nr:outer membrane protein assembly factor BamB [Pseudomonadales bacterium]
MNRSAKIWKVAAVAVSSVVLSACSLFSDDKNKEVIAPLVDLPAQEIRLDDIWSTRVGSQGDDVMALVLKPSLQQRQIFAANAKGKVTAMDRSTGEVHWKHDLDVGLIGEVGADQQLVVVSDEKGGIYALNAANGEQRWKAQASSEVLAAAAVNEDVVVVQAIDSRVQAFDAATGKPRWSYAASQAVLTLRGNSSPVMREGVVYAAFDNGKIVALNAKTGLMQWEQRFIVPEGRSELERVIDVQADPIVSATDIIVGCYQGVVARLEREKGQLQWEEKASIARNMAVGDGSVFIVEADDSVRGLRLGTGREAWKSAAFGGRHLSAAATIGDYVAVADKEGYVHLLAQSDGSYVGRYDVGGGGVRSNNLFSDGGVLYALTNSGKLYALVLKR